MSKLAPIIWKLTFCYYTESKKKDFGVTGANFDLNYLSYFWTLKQSTLISNQKTDTFITLLLHFLIYI